METIHQFIQAGVAAGYLPAMLQYGFVINALLAGCMLGPLLGGLGVLVVVKRFAFFSEAVGHAALTGIAIGVLLGEPHGSPYGGLFGYCVLFALLMNYLRNRTGLAPDALIGVFLSVSLALGSSILMALAARINIHILENVLFGSVLTIDGNDLLILLLITLAALVCLFFIYNQSMLASFHPQLARGLGRLCFCCTGYARNRCGSKNNRRNFGRRFARHTRCRCPPAGTLHLWLFLAHSSLCQL